MWTVTGKDTMTSVTNKRPLTSTSSFVAEVLATTGKRDKEDISATLDKLSSRIDHVKAEWYDSLQKKYIDFFPNLDSAVELNARADALSEEMHDLTCKIEREVKDQLNVSSSEFEELAVQLQESKLKMDILGKLMKVEESLACTKTALSNKDFVKAVTCQSIVNQTLQEPAHKREQEIQALVVMDNEFKLLQSNLQHSLNEAWKESVIWVLPSEGVKLDFIEAVLQVKNTNVAKEALPNTVQALEMLDLLDKKLAVFGEHLYEHVLKPLVRFADTTVSGVKESNPATLTIKRASRKSGKTPSPSMVFDKLQVVMQFLNDHLMNIPLGTAHDEPASEHAPVLMQRFGELTCEKYLKFLTDEFLIHSIPTNSRDFEDYDKVTNAISSFEEVLKAMNYLPADNHILAEFSGNSNLLFANKKTQEILLKARTLMKQDIHNTIKICGSTPSDAKPLGLEGSASKKKKTFENIALSNNSKLNQNTFRFPDCHISDYIQSLMTLCYETLHEAASSSTSCAVQLFYATRDMFELFCDVVPTYHKQSLNSLPQLAAIHHNNCMYLAHQLLTLGHQIAPHLPSSLSATYVDLVPRFRQLGTQCFMNMMSQQKSLLMESLSVAQGFQNLAEAENKEKAEQGVKQMLHQLRHLAAVWRDVLPTKIFCKAIGALVNSAVVEVIESVIALVDVSEDDSCEIHSIITLIVKQAPLLFTDTLEAQESSCEAVILKRVAKWGKLKELMLIQNASMQEIVDRWAEGKGPLAFHFKANEVKQVIRAVFQNTDRRANVLARIH